VLKRGLHCGPAFGEHLLHQVEYPEPDHRVGLGEVLLDLADLDDGVGLELLDLARPHREPGGRHQIAGLAQVQPALQGGRLFLLGAEQGLVQDDQGLRVQVRAGGPGADHMAERVDQREEQVVAAVRAGEQQRDRVGSGRAKGVAGADELRAAQPAVVPALQGVLGRRLCRNSSWSPLPITFPPRSRSTPSPQAEGDRLARLRRQAHGTDPLRPGLEPTIAGMSEVLHLGQAQPRLGELLRRATQDRERITITDPYRFSGPSPVLISAEDLTDLEDALVFAGFEAGAFAGTQVLVPHAEAMARLGFA